MSEAERFVKSIYPYAKCVQNEEYCYVWANQFNYAPRTVCSASKLRQEQAWEYMQRAIERKMISALEE